MAGFVEIVKNIQSQFRNWASNDVYHYTMNGTPTDGASGTGANVMGPGSTIIDYGSATVYVNFGTKAAPVWLAVGGPHVDYVKKVVLTSAQIKTLRAAPITIVPALGAGFVADFDFAAAMFLYGGSNAFTNPQDMVIRYKDGTGGIISQAITAAGFIDQTASQFTSVLGKVNSQLTKTQTDNQPLVLHNTGASEMTGNAAADNTLAVKIGVRVTQPLW